ncbi:MAG: chemotaxis protein CheW [Spirochaetae bacterium HGW-Spirochaetae-1]|jgi:purine-binding chemotaxis protein CheW|nr:MAG: chemotaxis protein CheW [Spirochaetae bacterium HGW-Spirochaetae-1]
MDIRELLKKDKEQKENDQSIEVEEVISGSSIIQLVSFVLDDVEYGVDILAVHEILRIPDITRLPNTPHFIKGVINLRGNVIPVVDVRKRFGYTQGKITDLTRIIVIETNDKQIGLLVDNVHQVVRIPVSHVDPPSELIEGVSDEFITGIGRLKDRLIVILNISNIIFEEEDETALVQSELMR